MHAYLFGPSGKLVLGMLILIKIWCAWVYEMNPSPLNEIRRYQMCHSNPVPRKGILVISLPFRTGGGPTPSARASRILTRSWMMQILLVSSEWTEIGTSMAKSPAFRHNFHSSPAYTRLHVPWMNPKANTPSRSTRFRIRGYRVADWIGFVHLGYFE